MQTFNVDDDDSNEAATTTATSEMPPQMPNYPNMAAEETLLSLKVRDLSSGPSYGSIIAIVLNISDTIADIFFQITINFKYDPTTYALSCQKSSGEEIELHKLPQSQKLNTFCIEELNNLVLRNLNGKPPRKLTDAECANLPSYNLLAIPGEDQAVGPREESVNSEGFGCNDIKRVSKQKEENISSPTSDQQYEIQKKNSYKSWKKTPEDNQQAEVKDSYIQPRDTYIQTGETCESPEKSPVTYVGLVNQAMTCYLNSLLQTLYMTPEFRNALYRWEYLGTEEEGMKNIPFQLQKLFLELQTTTRSAVETTDLTKSFGWDSSEAWQQHDIQELCRVMFDALEQSFKNTDQADLINNLYEGKMKDYVKCLECGTENAREDIFLDIPLPIKPFGSTTAYKSVEEALRAFVEPELLTGNNKYECSVCSSHCDAHKGLKFTRFPYLLTIHLKRFDFDYNTLHRIKLNDEVTFPNQLDLRSFIDTNVKDEPSKTSILAVTPDKGSDKIDDGASITDSGTALDMEESNSVELLSTQSQTDVDTQDEDEGMEDYSVYNEKNKSCVLASNSSEPYFYELFSIMVHSGSASGGHYYAYIKDFKRNQWFCFNDQNVLRITYDDIRKTYGGTGTRGYYFSSSANAYMLIYRQIDKNRNVDFFYNDELPPHIQNLVEKMMSEEEAEKEARENERNMKKWKVYYEILSTQAVTYRRLKLNQDVTLKEATKIAYEELDLKNDGIPLERCRLVKYDHLHQCKECSFENREDESLNNILNSQEDTYNFILFMEVREEGTEFEEYKPGETTLKVYIVDLSNSEVLGPHQLRVSQSLTVAQFKEYLGEMFQLNPLKMRIVKERFPCGFKPLGCDSSPLKAETFYRSNKVYIEASGQDPAEDFEDSLMHDVLDRYEHTITIDCFLPVVNDAILEEYQISRYIKDENSEQICSGETSFENPTSDTLTASETKNEVDSASLSTATSLATSLLSSAVAVSSTLAHDGATCSSESEKSKKKPFASISKEPNVDSTPSVAAGAASSLCSSRYPGGDPWSIYLSDREDEGDMDSATGSSSALNSDQSASEDSSLTSDSDRTLVGDDPHENKLSNTSDSPDYHNVSSPEEATEDREMKRYLDDFCTHMSDDSQSKEKAEKNIIYLLDKKEEELVYYFKALSISAENEDPKVVKAAVDSRITVGQLKKELQKYVGVCHEDFKINRCSILGPEFECARMKENLESFGDSVRSFTIWLSRGLKPDEYKYKFYLLTTDPEDPAFLLMDYIIRFGQSVSEVKRNVIEEVNAKYRMELNPELVWLRKKIWRNPCTIYPDEFILGECPILHSDGEFYLEELKEPKTINKDQDEIALFIKRWRPSSFSTDSFDELILKYPTAEELFKELSSLSDIAVEDILLARGRGAFPCDMCVFDLETDLDWVQPTGDLIEKPLAIVDDGAVLYFKDRKEVLKELSVTERTELVNKENLRLKRDCSIDTTATLSSIKYSKVKGLKIFVSPSSQ